MVHDIIVIGGGAAGLMAGITAARAGRGVLILDRGKEAGKKLLATGNGRCNFTNKKMDSAMFRGENPSFVLGGLNAFDERAAVDFFKGIGIEPKDKNGYIYPRSLEAKSVRNALVSEALRLGVSIRTGVKVTDIKISGDGEKKGRFTVTAVLEPGKEGPISVFAAGKLYADKLIVAAGGCADPSSGSDGSIFPVLASLGVDIVDTLPALCPLVCRDGFLKGLSGVRAECSAGFYVDGKLVHTSSGELQITDFGISGIVIFDGSRYISVGLHNSDKCHVTIDFIPEKPAEEVYDMLKERFYGAAGGAEGSPVFETAFDALCGLFNSKLAKALLYRAKIDKDEKPYNVPEDRMRSLAGIIKGCELSVTGTKGFDRAQVTRGGVATDRIDQDTMQHEDIPGLYFAGEVLDVDAVCGGYNLQWAWSSGYLAGRSAAESKEAFRV